MSNLTARVIDISVVVGVVALTVARWIGVVPRATGWGVAALSIVYLGWWLRRRSPYRIRNGETA